MKIAVIGGGASGMTAAISAARCGGEVTIYERFDRVGKKILATGNGRCNLTNINADICNYHGADTEFIRYTLNSFWVKESLAFFKELGLLYKAEDDGKVYPYSNVAASVLDVLRLELERLGVKFEYQFEAKSVRKVKNEFIIESYTGSTAAADRVIVAAGGKASPALGSNGSGYPILESFGHRLTELNPSLVQIKLKNNPFKSLNGLKVDAVISLKNGTENKGEVLFTDYGISGPAVFEISGSVGKEPSAQITLDLMKEYSKEEVFEILKHHRKVFRVVDELFCGIFAKRIGQVIVKNSIDCKLNADIKTLTDSDLKKISDTVKAFTVVADGTMSWNNAQVTAGGIEVSGFNPKTFESKFAEGLYATGEVLDIDGDCGGYNLQWAWSSGYIAGRNAVENG